MGGRLTVLQVFGRCAVNALLLLEWMNGTVWSLRFTISVRRGVSRLKSKLGQCPHFFYYSPFVWLNFNNDANEIDTVSFLQPKASSLLIQSAARWVLNQHLFFFFLSFFTILQGFLGFTGLQEDWFNGGIKTASTAELMWWLTSIIKIGGLRRWRSWLGLVQPVTVGMMGVIKIYHL